jgi:hypothetical protein
LVHDLVLLEYVGMASLVLFVVTLVAVPLVIRHLPEDHFLRYPQRAAARSRHPLLALIVFVLRNIVGGVLILAGIAMLFLPGQGVLTIVVGILVMHFPGKDHLVQWFLAKPSVQRALNWVRGRTGQKPFRFPRKTAP